MLRPSSKKIFPFKQQNQSAQKKKKKSNSQSKYFQAPDIITQMKPSYLKNFIQPMNPHQSAFTPSNHSNFLKDESFLLPPKSSEFANKKTLILDLDETLVHSSFTPFENNDIILSVDFDGVMYDIYVLVRPGTVNFIKNVSKNYEVVIFTASLSNYASPLLDILDPDNNIKYRLYREHCTFINGIYVKDLKKLNRNLKDVIIVDNSPLAYAFDNDNGMPIKTWLDDRNDTELIKINKVLNFLAKVKDVRRYIKQFVKENEIKYEEATKIINDIENKNKIIHENIALGNSDNINNDNKIISKTNVTNNLNQSGNNENNSSNYNNTGYINSTNKGNNEKNKSDVIFNINPINICPSDVEFSKNEETKKTGIKYKLGQNNQNKIKEGLNKKSNDSKNNKTLKSDIIHNSQIKKGIFSLHNISVMNNIIKKQVDDFEEAKRNEKLLLNYNVKLKQKTNNVFRLKQKNENKNNKINHNFINSNKFNSLLPASLSSSNTTKNLMPHNNNCFQLNNIKNIKNFEQIPKIKSNLSNIENKEKMKNNFINIIQDRKQNIKKGKYTNLINKNGSDKIKAYYQKILDKNKNNLKYEKFGLGNVKKSPQLRISSSIPSQRNMEFNNKRNNNYDKNYSPFHYNRSKSTGHFFKFGTKISPKTPNNRIKFNENTSSEIEKQQNTNNNFLYNGISFSNGVKLQNIQSLTKNEIDNKFKRSQSSKRK